MIQAMDAVGVHPIYMAEANEYSSILSSWNTSGLGNNIYIREAFQPLENAAQVPAVQQYINIVKAVGGKTNQLGEQAASSFLLWATAAKSCGSTLTRQCIINYLATVKSWTGGGMQCAGRPGQQPAAPVRTHHQADRHHLARSSTRRRSASTTATPSTSSR